MKKVKLKDYFIIKEEKEETPEIKASIGPVEIQEWIATALGEAIKSSSFIKELKKSDIAKNYEFKKDDIKVTLSRQSSGLAGIEVTVCAKDELDEDLKFILIVKQ